MAENKITRRNLIHRVGLAAAGATVLPIACTTQENNQNTDKKLVVRFAHLTDMHVEPGIGAEEGVARCIDHVLKNAGPVDFVVNGGDTIMDALGRNEEETSVQWATWRGIRAKYPDLKFYHCIGNHDVWASAPSGEKHQGKDWALRELGMDSPYYDFEANGWHFIVLDSTHLKDDGTWYTAKLDTAQREWLEQTIARIPSTKPIMIISHIPILGATPFLDGDNAKTGNWIVPGGWMHTDAKSLVNLFYNNKNVKACISGHIHLVETLIYHGVHYHCSGAVSGNWWDDEPYELTNKGYGLFELFDDGSHAFRYVEYSS